MYNIRDKYNYYYIPSLSYNTTSTATTINNNNDKITTEMKIELYRSIFTGNSREIISYDCQQSIKAVMNYVNEFQGIRDVKIANWILNSENENINMTIEDLCFKYLKNETSIFFI